MEHRHVSLFALAERTITAADLVAERLLFTVNPDQCAADVSKELKAQHFDVAPVNESPITRYLDAAETRTDTRSVAEAARPIRVECLIPAGLPLAAAIDALRTYPVLFVLDRGGVNAVLTRADLQLAPVSLVAFGFVVAVEAALDQFIERTHGDAWQELLTPQRLSNVKEVYATRQQANTEIGLLDSLNLDDRITIAAKTESIWRSLGFMSRKEFEKAGKRIKEFRNTLAHGGGLLDLEPDPVVAIDRLLTVRDLARRGWDELEAEPHSGTNR